MVERMSNISTYGLTYSICQSKMLLADSREGNEARRRTRTMKIILLSFGCLTSNDVGWFQM